MKKTVKKQFKHFTEAAQALAIDTQNEFNNFWECKDMGEDEPNEAEIKFIGEIDGTNHVEVSFHYST